MDPTNTPATPIPNLQLNRFTLLHKAGEGMFGEVYSALDPKLQRRVAIKIAKPHTLGTPDRVERFFREARACALLHHPNILPIFEVDQAGDRYYLVSPFIDGVPLCFLAEERPLRPIREIATLVLKLAEALHYAHCAGIIHRDVKPQNVMLDSRGEPLLMDFGLATRLAPGEERLTAAGTLLGTPAYIAPEQADGNSIAASDQYSLGCTLFELLTGRTLFDGSPTEQILAHQSTPPPRLSEFRTDCTRDLETIYLKCVAKSPTDRYATCGDLAADLRSFLANQPILARRQSSIDRLKLWSKRHPLSAKIASAALATIGLLVVVLGITTLQMLDADARARELRTKNDTAIRERTNAEQLAQAHAAAQRTSEYARLRSEAYGQLYLREFGWREKAMSRIAEASRIDTPDRNVVDLRAALLDCLGGTDFRELRTLEPDFYCRYLTFHPDGRSVLLAEGRTGVLDSSDLRIKIVDFRTGQLQRTLTFPGKVLGGFLSPRPEFCNGVAISPDGNWVAAHSRSNLLYLWDLRLPTNSPVVLNANAVPSGNYNLAFSPDNSTLIQACKIGSHGEIRCWDLATKSLIAKHHQPHCIGGMAVHPKTGEVICLGQANALTRLAPRTLTPIVTSDAQWQHHKVTEAFSCIPPSGNLLAVTANEFLEIYRPDTLTHTYTFRLRNSEASFYEARNSLAVSPNDRLIVCCDEFSQTVEVFDICLGQLVSRWRVGPGRVVPAFDPSGRFLAISSMDGTQLYEVLGQQEHRVVATGTTDVLAAAISPDGSQLATLLNNPGPYIGPTPELWSLDTPLRATRRFSGERLGTTSKEARVQFTANRNWLVSVTDAFRIYDSQSPPRVRVNQTRDNCPSVVLAPDDRLWLLLKAQVLSTDLQFTPALQESWYNLSAPLSGLGDMACGDVRQRWAAFGGVDGIVRLFSTTAKRPKANRLPVPNEIAFENRVRLDAIAISPEEEWIVAGSQSGHCHLISIERPDSVYHWQPHADHVEVILFLKQHQFLTAGKDRRMRCWQIVDGQPVELLSTHLDAEITSMSKSADGRFLTITCRGERGVHLWDLDQLNARLQEMNLTR
ncbi:WD40 repeat domain-containing serine/threonine protein kinase [Tuwongella immobilis]|nr:WD40 repeat domain-containing serine/threonine protein kinase [Tuwongella immobilis]